MRLFVVLFLFSALSISAQQQFSADSIIAFQRDMNLKFIDSVTSPLTPVDRHMFTGLNFFVPDSTYSVKAKLV
ncbi:MAG: hypothetical protein ITG00_03455, partial [Flavobacterium sp.]|nr:hypothetical protein [Flavobacterium sp.]